MLRKPSVQVILLVVVFILLMGTSIAFGAPPLVTGFIAAVPIGVLAFVFALKNGLRQRQSLATDERSPRDDK